MILLLDDSGHCPLVYWFITSLSKREKDSSNLSGATLGRIGIPASLISQPLQQFDSCSQNLGLQFRLARTSDQHSEGRGFEFLQLHIPFFHISFLEVLSVKIGLLFCSFLSNFSVNLFLTFINFDLWKNIIIISQRLRK